MLPVAEAERIVLSHARSWGQESLPFLAAQGRVLAEDIRADRDLPPYDRVTMDGIAIRFADYEAGCRHFPVETTQAAGDPPVTSLSMNACIEIMTGAAIAGPADAVVPYEHLQLSAGVAQINEPVRKGQNIHRQGQDKRRGDHVIPVGKVIGPAEISMAASVGKSVLLVKKLPRTVILSSGDELVDVTAAPLPHQIRRSNSYTLQAALQRYGIEADLRHLPDAPDVILREIKDCLQSYDLMLLSGGVSMGKFDYIPQALRDAGVQIHFDKVRQRPGKPLQFGTFGNQGVVFALPGNPVSTFLCLQRYVLPWLEHSLGFPGTTALRARLETTVHFEPDLTYFMQVKTYQDEVAAQQWAIPLQGQGSGDFANLLDANAFLELPAGQNVFEAGDVFRLWYYGF
ncbi:MAG: molybdopterin molybdotransferase MoeA [Saprospiraceae bacterium]|nr:molybdopterin molybdotransferase MoeA [Saprospiraceae bacterium]